MNVVSLLSVVEKLVKGEVAIEFVKSPRDGNKVFSAFQHKDVRTSLAGI